MSNMATALGAAEATDVVKSEPGFVSRILATMIKSREAKARRHIAGYLARASDQQLRDFGFNQQQIEKVRVEGRIPASFWA